MKLCIRVICALIPALLFSSVVGCTDPKVEIQNNQNLVRGKVLEKIEPFTVCFNEAQVANEDLKGKIAFSLTVKKDGSATDVKLTLNELDKNVGDCFLKVIETIEFPKVSQDTPYHESFCFEVDPDGTICKKK